MLLPPPLPLIAMIRGRYARVEEYVVHAIEMDGERVHLLAGPHRLPADGVPCTLWSPTLPPGAESVQLAALTVHAGRARAESAMRELLRRVRTAELRLEALETLPFVVDHVDQSLRLPRDTPPPRFERIE